MNPTNTAVETEAPLSELEQKIEVLVQRYRASRYEDVEALIENLCQVVYAVLCVKVEPHRLKSGTVALIRKDLQRAIRAHVSGP